MRALLVPVLFAALIAGGGCDRQSARSGQGGENPAAPTRDDATEVSPDEAVGPAKAVKPGTFDRSHRGDAAPDFAFTDPAGKRVTLADFRGRPVLVNLWATWCAPCIKEMPTLDALAARGQVAVVALSQDMEADRVAPFWARGGYRALKPYYDGKLAFSTALAATLPTTILYDARGKEVWRLTGGYDWAGAEAAKAIVEG